MGWEAEGVVDSEVEGEIGGTGVEGLAAEGLPLPDEEEGAGEEVEEAEEVEAPAGDEDAAEEPFAEELAEAASFCEGALDEAWPHPARAPRRVREAATPVATFNALPSFTFPPLPGS